VYLVDAAGSIVHYIALSFKYKMPGARFAVTVAAILHLKGECSPKPVGLARMYASVLSYAGQ
jgi:hypothetical protein